MRKLASIRTIDSILSIEGADQIELVTFGGWQCVTRKNEFAVGQKCVYFEIDSFLPVKPEFEFLRARCFKSFPKKEGFRLKSIKLKGQISQGLVLPLATAGLPDDVEVDSDVTERLGVELYEPNHGHYGDGFVGRVLAANHKGLFPGFLTKTDQERIQNLGGMMPTFSTLTFEITEKVDGSSCTMFLKDGEFGVCSRNFELKLDDDNMYCNLAKLLDVENKLKALGRNIAIQGELLGPKIQQNKYHLDTHQFMVFDIINIDLGRFMTPDERLSICAQLGLAHVPVLARGALIPQAEDNRSTILAILAAAEGKSQLFDTEREGVVYKAETAMMSFKAISNKFLLKHDN